jgi:hypothetical protein
MSAATLLLYYSQDPASITLYAHLLASHHSDAALADKYYRSLYYCC